MGVEQLELDASPLLEEVVDLSFGDELGMGDCASQETI
jgi:hypothetical protein